MKQQSISMMMAMTVAVMLAGYSTSAYDWTNAGTGNSWGTADNWDPSVVPGSGDTANIGMTDPDQAVVDGTHTVKEVFVGRSADGELNIVDGGDLTVNGQIRAGRDDQSQDAGDGWINQTGGTLTVTGSSTDFRLGSDDRTGYYNLSGGLLDTTNARDLDLGQWSGGRGEFTISGGQLKANSLRVARYDAGDEGVSGVFTVKGTWANSQIAAENFTLGTSDAGGHGTLDLQFENGGVTPIEVTNDVTFGEHEANLDVSFLDDPVEGTWDVMTWEGSLTGASNLEWATGVDESVWSYNIDDTNKTMSITAVPEPSSLILLGLAGLLLMKRRRV